MALMVGAMTIHGIIPGPQVMTKSPQLFWGMIASMWVGNLMLLIINLPLIGLWVRLLKVPYRLMFPAILMFCCIGIYSATPPTSQWIAVFLSSACLIRFGFEPLRCCSFLSRKADGREPRRLDHLPRHRDLIERPISAVLLLVAVALLTIALLPRPKKREEVLWRTFHC